VEQTLSGHAEGIKERAIGIEVFERESDYDTNADPIVRVAAGEVRKRLAQYYYEAGREEEIHIELPTGSYAPVFYLPVPLPSVAERLQVVPTLYPPPAGGFPHSIGTADSGGEPSGDKPDSRSTVASRPAKIRRVVWLGIPLLAVLSVVFFSHGESTKESQGFDQFWNQVTQANGSVQFCFGTFSAPAPAGPGIPIMMSSVGTMMRIRDLLDARSKTYLNAAMILGPDPPDLTQFRDGPVIYVGPYMPVHELIEPLRYSFVEEDRAIWVRDRQSPSEHQWRTDHPSVPVQQTSESYAILTRLWDRNLKRPMVVVAGVSPLGTVAAAEVLTNPKYMTALLQNAPANWMDMNLEAVIKTNVVEGKPGPPRVVATYFWK
jgi:hypothetical protein